MVSCVIVDGREVSAFFPRNQPVTQAAALTRPPNDQFAHGYATEFQPGPSGYSRYPVVCRSKHCAADRHATKQSAAERNLNQIVGGGFVWRQSSTDFTLDPVLAVGSNEPMKPPPWLLREVRQRKPIL